ncbi:MAG: hypothetical protein K0U60_08820 [Actinomycetia bacterium]|nr:hypothetical protein [Actinomycetes bacterium]MCH9801066.1 hypothetical protein [Actinomycetes bacterium]
MISPTASDYREVRLGNPVASVQVAWSAASEVAAGAGVEAGELAATSGTEVAEDSGLVGNFQDWQFSTVTDNNDVVMQMSWILGSYN